MNKEGGRGSNVWVPQVGINGLLFAAARDHREEFGSVDDAEFGPMVDVGGVKAPEWAKVAVWKKGIDRPTIKTAYWDEYAPDITVKSERGYKHPFWRKMPRRMLSKCATALALREAYPDLGGLYIEEEMAKMDEDAYTASGRQIVEAVSHNGSHEAAQAVAQAKIEKATRGEQILELPPKIASNSDLREPGDEPARPMIEIIHTNEAFPIVMGWVAEIPGIKEACPSWHWGEDSFWHVKAGDVENLRALCRKLGYEVKETVPRQPSQKGGRGTVQTKQSPAGAGSHLDSPAPAPTQSVTAIIDRVQITQTKQNQQMAYITLLGHDKTKKTYGCFDKDMVAHLQKGQGKTAELVLQERGQYINITAIKHIGSIEFEDGKVPIVSTNREPGGSLFK
jgi:hypothetical protein